MVIIYQTSDKERKTKDLYEMQERRSCMKKFIPDEVSVFAELVGMFVGMVMITVPYWYKKKDKTNKKS